MEFNLIPQRPNITHFENCSSFTQALNSYAVGAVDRIGGVISSSLCLATFSRSLVNKYQKGNAPKASELAVNLLRNGIPFVIMATFGRLSSLVKDFFISEEAVCANNLKRAQLDPQFFVTRTVKSKTEL